MEYGEVSFRKGVKTDVEAVVELLKERCRWTEKVYSSGIMKDI